MRAENQIAQKIFLNSSILVKTVGNKIYLFYKLKRTKIKNKSTKFNTMITTYNFFITLKMIFEDSRKQKSLDMFRLKNKQKKKKKRKKKKPYIVFMNLMCGNGVRNWKNIGERIQQFSENFRESFLWTSSKVVKRFKYRYYLTEVFEIILEKFIKNLSKYYFKIFI